MKAPLQLINERKKWLAENGIEDWNNNDTIDVIEEFAKQTRDKADEELKKYGKFCDGIVEEKNTMIIELNQKIKSLTTAIKEYEEDIPKLGNTILACNKDVIGFAEWMDKENYHQVLNPFHPETGKWCKNGLDELHRPYFTTSELLSKYRESKNKPA